MSEPKSEVFLMDCMEGMKRYPDKHFDLAIVDPPYGIDAANILSGPIRKSGNGKALKSAFAAKDWDSEVPNQDYFSELFRVSKNQIIWGANYMAEYIPNSQGWVVWDKENGTTNFADAELAFTSFDRATRIFRFMWNGMLQGNMKNKEDRIHPTQKPVALYKWLLKNYAKPDQTILDTHLGSGSSRIAAHEMGFDFTGFDIDPDYFYASDKRFQQYKSQLKIFQ